MNSTTTCYNFYIGFSPIYQYPPVKYYLAYDDTYSLIDNREHILYQDLNDISSSIWGGQFQVSEFNLANSDEYFQETPLQPSGTECFTISDVSSSSSSSDILTVRDDGSLIFGIGLVIFLLSLMVFGMIFTSKKKR